MEAKYDPSMEVECRQWMADVVGEPLVDVSTLLQRKQIRFHFV